MTLPEITLPKIDLPFDIPVLLHPSIDHFAIVLPVIVLLLEFYNLFAKRKSIGVFSFILLLLTVVVFAATYFTGLVDGKEAFDLLPQEGQDALKEHKLLGTYLLLGSLALLFFKLLAMTGKKLLKVLFFLVLLGFIVVTFEQGKDGGELVYKHGANVERVKVLDDRLFDAQDALEDVQEPKVQKQKIEEKKPQEEQPQDEQSKEKKPKPVENETAAVETTSVTQPSKSVGEQTATGAEDKTIELKTDIIPSTVITEEVPKEKLIEVEKVKEVVQETPAIQVPEVPAVPKVKEVSQSEDVLKKFEESFKDITSDMDKLKIQTH